MEMYAHVELLLLPNTVKQWTNATDAISSELLPQTMVESWLIFNLARKKIADRQIDFSAARNKTNYCCHFCFFFGGKILICDCDIMTV